MPSFAQTLAQTQTQRQTMAQIMAMRLSPVLEMSQQQVNDRILQEIEMNPVVEPVDRLAPDSLDGMREAFDEQRTASLQPAPPPETLPPEVPPPSIAPDSSGEGEGGGEGEPPLDFDDGFQSIARADADETDLYFQDGGSEEFSPDAEERRQFRYDSISRPESMVDHLLGQLAAQDLAPADHDLALEVIGSLDSRGFLESSLADIAQAHGATLDDAQRALAVIQSFDPPGIAARTLAECFLRQLEAAGLDDVLAAQFLRERPDFFRPRDIRQPSLAPNFQCVPEDIPALAAAFQCSEADVRLALDDLRCLDPAPGDRFVQPDRDIILTDATVVQRNGRYVVLELENDAKAHADADSTPPFRISPEMRALADDSGADPAFREEIRGRIAQAEELVQHVSNRRDITLAVAAAIVARQQSYFERRSLEALRPMIQEDIANDIGIDASVVSRACKGKWMKTPFGNLKFSDFFSRGLGGVPTRTIKDRVRQVVDAEDKSAPLSDSAIAAKLLAEGVEIARTTVKKYRNELGIPSSTARKRP